MFSERTSVGPSRASWLASAASGASMQHRGGGIVLNYLDLLKEWTQNGTASADQAYRPARSSATRTLKSHRVGLCAKVRVQLDS